MQSVEVEGGGGGSTALDKLFAVTAVTKAYDCHVGGDAAGQILHAAGGECHAVDRAGGLHVLLAAIDGGIIIAAADDLFTAGIDRPEILDAAWFDNFRPAGADHCAVADRTVVDILVAAIFDIGVVGVTAGKGVQLPI